MEKDDAAPRQVDVGTSSALSHVPFDSVWTKVWPSDFRDAVKATVVQYEGDPQAIT